MKIGFYIKGSEKTELITIKEFCNMTDAIETFAQMKNLPVTCFLELFNLHVIKD